MPIKVIVMVKRRPDLTPAQFRDGYENSHSRIAVELSATCGSTIAATI